MKTLRWFILIFCLLLPAVSRAQITYSNLLTYGAVNNTTNNGSSVIIGTARITPPTYSFHNGGLATTNALYVNIQISFDNTNFVTISTYTPTRTNTTIDAVSLPVQRMTVFSRAQVVTTNSVNFGGSTTFGATIQ